MQDTLHQAQEGHATKLKDLKEKTEALAGDNSVLRRLYFDDMYKRADSITDATEGTFDWLLANEDTSSDTSSATQSSDSDEPQTSEQFREQYECQRREENSTKISAFLEDGKGVFFLRGKPGSGKSTLMKYLTAGRGRQKVDQRLRKWAGQKRLIRVSTMFLLHGTPLQRSLEGFWRTFFFELFCVYPDLVDVLFPDFSTRGFADDSYRSSFRLETLQAAWARLVSIRHHTMVRICVFIDGLDELEGNSSDRLKFSQILKDWAESEDIKIICSGRPNAEFNIVFNQPDQRIDLQDLTRADIRNILTTRFEGVRHLSDLTSKDIEELVTEISDQSEGVILWAVLVGKNLEDDIIHGTPLSAMKYTIQTLPSGIEYLYNSMWQDLRHDAHQQLMLRTIYELLVLYNGTFIVQPLSLSWLEQALSDDEFPYNQPVQPLSITELQIRLDKVRGKLIQYTKHFVEVTGTPANFDVRYGGSCRFIHRSAQEFIQSKLGPVGSSSARPDYTFELELRLNLSLEMSVERAYPTECFGLFYTRPFNYPTLWRSHRQDPVRQLPHRLMEKLGEILDVRRSYLSGDSTTGAPVEDYWSRIDIRYRSRGHGCVRARTFSLFHLAIRYHQVDCVKGILSDRTRQPDREAVCLGLLICVAGWRPSYALFQLLVDHGADLDCHVEVYQEEGDKPPELTPLWFLFCFSLASKVSGKSDAGREDELERDLREMFLILERFLRLGHGVNVKFLAAAAGGDSEPDGGDVFGVDLTQVVRYAKPDNMDRLLSLLGPLPETYLSLAQNMINLVLQPQYPFRTLPQGSATTPYRTVSDDYLDRKRWEVWGAFDGEHELKGGAYYYIPG